MTFLDHSYQPCNLTADQTNMPQKLNDSCQVKQFRGPSSSPSTLPSDLDPETLLDNNNDTVRVRWKWKPLVKTKSNTIRGRMEGATSRYTRYNGSRETYSFNFLIVKLSLVSCLLVLLAVVSQFHSCLALSLSKATS